MSNTISKGEATILQILLLVLFTFNYVSAATLQVGAGKQYTLPSQAAAVAQDGDVIEIDVGMYPKDATIWRANNLTIRGVGGRAHIQSDGVMADGGTGLWVIKGNNTTIENIEISGAVSDGAGSGIRLQGNGLILRNSFLHDNEHGILTNNQGLTRTSDVIIEGCEFARNGNSEGQAHNIYIGEIRSFTLRNSWSHDSNGGQLVKSRALINYILYNRLVDSPGGLSNYELDLSCGGIAYVIGNVLYQAPETFNPVIVTFAPEWDRLSCPTRELYTHEFYFVHNTVVNTRNPGYFLQLRQTLAQEVIENNLFVGEGYHLRNQAYMTVPVSNMSLPLNDTGFVDIAKQKYRLTLASIAVNKAITLPSAPLMPLTPILQYAHPHSTQVRTVQGASVDVGAYEAGLADTDVWPVVIPPPPVVLPTVITTLPIPAAPGWYELGNTKMRSVCVQPSPGGVEGCSAVIDDWNSGAFDTKRNRLLLWGGGHAGYYGNELYALNLTTLKMERLNEPGLPVKECAETTANGTQPASRHIYDGVTYLAKTDQFLSIGGIVACGAMGGGNFPPPLTWTFDFATMQWKEPAPFPVNATWVLSSYDSVTGQVLFADLFCVYRYDPMTKTTTPMSKKDCSWPAMGDNRGYATSVIDPVRRHFYLIGRGDMLRADISSAGDFVPRPLATTGPSPAGGGWPGVAYDERTGHLVVWMGGDIVYIFNPDTLVWTAHTFPGGPGAANLNGTYKRWAYSSKDDVFVVVNSVDRNAFVLRLARDGVIPPVPVPVPVDPVPSPPVVPPTAPTGLISTCAPEATHATLKWETFPGATGYALRVDHQANNSPGCSDGWFCDGSDVLENNHTLTDYQVTIVPGDTYAWWVHAITTSGYTPASGATFVCTVDIPVVPPIVPPVLPCVDPGYEELIKQHALLQTMYTNLEVAVDALINSNETRDAAYLGLKQMRQP